MKQVYEIPSAKITYFQTEDIMSASQPDCGTDDGNEVWE